MLAAIDDDEGYSSDVSLRARLLCFALALVTLPVVAGCSVLNLTTNCGDDSDCYVNERCVEGSCRAFDAGDVVAVECTQLDNCDGETYCLDQRCVPLPSCEEERCPEGTFCWPNDLMCRRGEPACTVDDDCDDGLFCTINVCNPATLLCEVTGDPCPLDTPVCDEPTDSCQVCVENQDCDDDNFCNGPEYCVDNVCVAGNPPCVDDPLRFRCDETNDLCAACLVDAHCEVNDPCVLNRRCGANGECTVPESPCDAQLDCVVVPLAAGDGGTLDAGAGTADGGAPDLLTFRCECDSVEDCDDGKYCNGAETCDQATKACVAGTNPCEATGENCLEALQGCGDCTQDGDCDQTDLCAGYQTCNAGSGECENNGAMLDCTDPLGVCSEDIQVCVQCVVSDDCDPIPVTHELWLARDPANERSQEGCFDKFCTEFSCEWARRCPGPGNPSLNVCGCDDGDCSDTDPDDWECRECNVDEDCSPEKGGPYCENPDAFGVAPDEGCQICRDTSTSGTDDGCGNNGNQRHCWDDNPLYPHSCAICTEGEFNQFGQPAADHCDDGDDCTDDHCDRSNFFNQRGCFYTNACEGNPAGERCHHDITGGDCVECYLDGHCGAGNFCLNNQCVDCLNNNDCLDGNLCTNDVCNNNQCINTYACPGQQCVSTSGICVDCLNNNDCNDFDPCTDNFCNGAGSCSFPDKCQADEICLSNGACVECTNNGHCSDGDNCTNDFCNGSNVCVYPAKCQADEICQADGTCVECVNDGQCPGSSVCEANQCVECRNAAQCNDGNNCTNDVCTNNSCSNPDACPGEECVPATGVCVECLGNNDCSDGDLCTNDVCNNNACTFPDACPGQSCNPGNGQCVECVNNPDCNGNPSGNVCSNNQCVVCASNPDCNGNPSGNVCSNNQCVVCASNPDCNGNPAGNVCNNNQCVECVGNGDCSGNPSGNVCSNNQCVECVGNGDCSDGDLCTEDICSGNSCTNPDACPGEQCVVGTGACVECLNDTHCTMPATCDLGTNTCVGG